MRHFEQRASSLSSLIQRLPQLRQNHRGSVLFWNWL